MYYEIGYKAYVDGIDLKDNPFKLIYGAGLEWCQGWQKAQLDYQNNKLDLV